MKDVKIKAGFGNSVYNDETNRLSFNYTSCETVMQGQDNTWIVLGKDRPSGSYSGHGGIGGSKSGAIYLVAGRLSALDAKNFSKEKVVNSNFGADGAGIYISQRADVDDYYNLADGFTGKSKNRSTVAIKADDIRLISRNTFKIVTKTDDIDSNKEWVDKNTGVQLIANNSAKLDDMQPIPKGKNLYNCILDLSSRLHELTGQILEFMSIQRDFNQAISSHKHLMSIGTNPAQLPTSEGLTSDYKPLSIEGKSNQIQLFTNVEQQINFIHNNIESLVNTYLFEGSEEYINSKYHKLN